MGMASGKVKWFNNAKGYGFINEDGKTEDLFAHYSAIQVEGYKTVKANQPVTFDIVQGPKGMQATNIVLVDTPATTNVEKKSRNTDLHSKKQHA
ncbi:MULTISPECIES: cold shock domain-containing protein [Pseudomonas]|jgi:CspA family cold shock protein|nr:MULTISPECIES: cold shock domain-containing protein [Pseudomonas]OPB02462.1 cold-shock protein [Pseudomonas synxantha]